MRRSMVIIALLALAVTVTCVTHSAVARPLVSDISSHTITINTSFEGTELMLFGARNEPGDVVVVVRGPEHRAVVRRKEKVWGIWVNRKKQVFDEVPSFFAMAASRPFEEISKSIYFQALGIGYQEAIHPYFPVLPDVPETALKGEEVEAIRQEFSHALLRYLREERLYSRAPGQVKFIGETLFKTKIPFPDNMPRGVYTAEVYLFSEGELIGVQVTPILVQKSGFDAFVYEGAQEHGVLYGMIAVLLALLAGWGASVIFQRI